MKIDKDYLLEDVHFPNVSKITIETFYMVLRGSFQLLRNPRSNLVEGDEHQDQPNSPTCV